MNIIDFTDEKSWLEARKKYITASDAANYCGINKYDANGKTTLWLDKTGIQPRPYIGDKPAVIKGSQAENPVRELFMLNHPEFELMYNEYGLAINEDEPWAASTLDGLLIENATGDIYIYEGKTTTVRNGKGFKEWEEGSVPPNYLSQGAHQLMTVPEAKGIYFFCWQMCAWKEDSSLLERYFSREEMEENIEFCRISGRKMAENIKNRIRPIQTFTI